MPPYAELSTPSLLDKDETEVYFEGIELEAEEKNGKLLTRILSMEDSDILHKHRVNPLLLSRKLEKELEEDDDLDPLGTWLSCGGCQLPVAYKEEPLLKSAMRRTPSSSSSVPRSVSFTSLEIREYTMTLGDHPSASSGPPVTLDWTYHSKETRDLDQYEQARGPKRRRKQLKLSLAQREALLVRKGFSMMELKEAWQRSLEVRKQRYETVMQSIVSTKMEEAWQSACRKFWRMFDV
eukprot:CAMPEP_0116844048 /NCGR_PEP_ID=MMETSP0418-20121206/12446_1 /TAXON_ID=1158023 /ORGANISM="Astrosyne radiata, Strain 13vi08-1A" /LENGTH=236 /DNA_ID=CAMNT_0004474907 /DNA_START=159 /DNA_END=869 /DNA_ORIENTATION=-